MLNKLTWNQCRNEKKLKDNIKPLYQKECLTKKEYDSIYPMGSRPGILYGSAKVHKPIIDNCPFFWPILSTIGTPTYDALRDLVPFVQFKKGEKHPWRSVHFSKVAGFNLQLY